MFERNRTDNVSTSAVAAQLTLADGEVLKGRMLAVAGRNFLDALNSPVPFVEFETYEGDRRFVAKHAIRDVKPLATPGATGLARDIRDADGFDPYAILGLAVGATPEAIKSAYHRLSLVYHPDRYATAELPDEVNGYLAAMARRINAAYVALEKPAREARLAASRVSQPIYTSDPRR